MVMVMSNLMTKRKNRKKRTAVSQYPPGVTTAKAVKLKQQQPFLQNPDFYF